MGFDPAAEQAVADDKKPRQRKPDAAAPPRKAAPLLLEVPSESCEPGYASPHVEANRLLPRQAAALKRLRCSLAAANARVPLGGANHPDGRVVDSGANAVRWLLEQYANAFEAETKQSITDGMSF